MFLLQIHGSCSQLLLVFLLDNVMIFGHHLIFEIVNNSKLCSFSLDSPLLLNHVHVSCKFRYSDFLIDF